MTSDFSSLSVPGPTRTALTAPFWAAAQEGRLTIQHCDDCRRAVFYPRALCPHCWSNRLRWRDATGRGHLKSFSVVHRPGHPAWSAMAPYTIGLVALEEGPTMLSHILVPFGRLAVGMPLRVAMTRVGQEVLPFFGAADRIEKEDHP